MNGQRLHFLFFLFFLFFLLFIISIKKEHRKEGFVQTKLFISKKDEDIYDNFYAMIYKTLYESEENSEYITNIIINDTLANKKTSIILIIGCETGIQANKLQLKEFDTYIIDKSVDMVNNALLSYPKLKTKVGNIMNPMLYDKSTFSHILSTGFTMYYIKDKSTFFRNIFQWLISGGYFIIQLIDRDKFNTILPAGRSQILNSPQNFALTRITETNINFGTFQYQSKYNFDNVHETNIVTMIENFTDSKTNKIRQNNHTFYIEPLDITLNQLRDCGFIIKGQYKLKTDEYQFIYIIERPN